MWKGDDRVLAFTVEDQSELSGVNAEWTMGTEDLVTKHVIKTTTGYSGAQGGITITGNVVYVAIDSADTDETSGISANEYYHELQLEDDDGKVTVAATGTVDLRDPIKVRT